jgi:hypothetical protein
MEQRVLADVFERSTVKSCGLVQIAKHKRNAS